jgi:hypothetical protein
MADRNHVNILRQGIEAWNVWRAQNPLVRPDLSGANLSNRDLSQVNFSGALLVGVNLSKTNLHLANFGPAVFEESLAMWRSTRLESANLEGSDLTQAYFVASFFKTKLSGALCRHTRFVDVDNIANALGLDRVNHRGACSIGIDTIIKGGGSIPEIFLRGCGYDPIIQEYVIRGGRIDNESIRLKRCFISYNRKNKIFVSKLSRRLNELRVDYWYDEEHMIHGAGIQDQITYEIASRDRMILVCSKEALESGWVTVEIEKATAEELSRKAQGKRDWRILFPIMIDNTFLTCDDPAISLLRKDRVATDFRRATKGIKFERALLNLIRGLRHETHET